MIHLYCTRRGHMLYSKYLYLEKVNKISLFLGYCSRIGKAFSTAVVPSTTSHDLNACLSSTDIYMVFANMDLSPLFFFF